MKKYLVICFLWDHHKHYLWHEMVNIEGHEDFTKDVIVKAGLQTDYDGYDKDDMERLYKNNIYDFVVEEILP